MIQRTGIALFLLSLMATSAFAAIQNSDFAAMEDGSVVYIDGAQGAKLHLEYTGAPRPTPLKVKITPDDPGLKLSGATCTVKKPGDICTSTLHLTNTRNKIYGVHQLTVTEVGGTAPTGTADTPPPVTFGVGIKEKGAPKRILWKSNCWFCGDVSDMSSPIVLRNATSSTRAYRIEQSSNGSSRLVNLPPHSICYGDNGIFDLGDSPEQDVSVRANSKGETSDPSLFVDVTDPNNKIGNGYYGTGNDNITTCSAEGGTTNRCATGLWGSMSLGLANIGGEDRVATSWTAKPEDDLNAGQVKVISDNRWGEASFGNPGSIIYWQKSWASSTMALLQIQGSTDGSGFDVKKAAPTALQIKAAPPCSTYIQK